MVTRIQSVSVPELPPANGHYSHGVMFNGTLYVSGQLGRGPHMTAVEAGGVERQTRRSLNNLRAVLRASSCDFHDLLKVNVYISDISQ